MSSRKLKALAQFYFVRPLLNVFYKDRFFKCPVCKEFLQWYSKNGYLHLCDGDRDCYGVLGKGK